MSDPKKIEPSVSDQKFADLKRRAESGDRDAQVNLGYAQSKNGAGTKDDYEKAAHWYLKAAKQEHPLGQKLLADCYAQGLGVPKDSKQAGQWLKRSAENGYWNAQLELGLWYERGGDGFSRDLALAFVWCEEAAMGGDSDSVANRDRMAGKLGREDIKNLPALRRQMLTFRLKRKLDVHLKKVGKAHSTDMVKVTAKIFAEQEFAMERFWAGLLGRTPWFAQITPHENVDLFEAIPWREADPQFSLAQWEPLITKAAKQNDQKFFVQLGAVLAQEPREMSSYDKLDFLLVQHWTAMGHGIPPLCLFTDDALLDLCEATIPGGAFTFDQVRKARQRVGLEKPPSKYLVVREIELLDGKYRVNAGKRSTLKSALHQMVNEFTESCAISRSR